MRKTVLMRRNYLLECEFLYSLPDRIITVENMAGERRDTNQLKPAQVLVQSARQKFEVTKSWPEITLSMKINICSKHLMCRRREHSERLSRYPTNPSGPVGPQ